MHLGHKRFITLPNAVNNLLLAAATASIVPPAALNTAAGPAALAAPNTAAVVPGQSTGRVLQDAILWFKSDNAKAFAVVREALAAPAAAARQSAPPGKYVKTVEAGRKQKEAVR